MHTIREQHFSKYPLIEEDKDDIIGVVSVKDIILMPDSDEPFDLRSIARQPLYIPESLYAKKVLEVFKKNKNKFGVVVDEYGNTAGIITLHDLKEEDFTTLSGLAMFLIGRVPKAGDTFSYQNLKFEVMDMDRGRVDKLLVYINLNP